MAVIRLACAGTISNKAMAKNIALPAIALQLVPLRCNWPPCDHCQGIDYPYSPVLCHTNSPTLKPLFLVLCFNIFQTCLEIWGIRWVIAEPGVLVRVRVIVIVTVRVRFRVRVMC